MVRKLRPEDDYDIRDYNNYDFYKSPDGEDCLEKTLYYTKYSSITGTVFAVYEMAIMSRPSTVPAMIGRFFHFTVPFAAMGFTFGASLCLIAQLRKKNDVPNHVFAGMIAGTVWGMKYRSMFMGHTCSVIAGFLAGYHKYFKVHNLPMYVVRSRDSEKYNSALDWQIHMYDDPGRPNEA